METIKRQIETLGTAKSASELNVAYNQLAIAIAGYDFSGIAARSEMERTLCHIANYNLVRIANLAAGRYEQSNRTDRDALIEVALCRDSVKPCDDSDEESDLLEGLCAELEIS